jgi:hypothetical protein
LNKTFIYFIIVFKACVGHGRILFKTLKCFGKSYHIPLLHNVYNRHLYGNVFTLDYWFSCCCGSYCCKTAFANSTIWLWSIKLHIWALLGNIKVRDRPQKCEWPNVIWRTRQPKKGCLAFQYFDYERTCWMFFQKLVVRTQLDIYVLLKTLCIIIQRDISIVNDIC